MYWFSHPWPNICTHSGMRLASVLLPSAESEVPSASKAPSPILRPFLHRSTWRAEIESPFAVRKRELDKVDKPTLVSSSVLPFPTFGERIVIRNVMTYLEKQSFRWFYPKYTVLAIALRGIACVLCESHYKDCLALAWKNTSPSNLSFFQFPTRLQATRSSRRSERGRMREL